jgi:hypothetical protein
MPSALSKVKARLRTDWAANSALATCNIIDDGIGITSSPSADLLLIGDDGDPNTEVSSSVESYYVDIAQTRRQENGEIPCAVIAQSGSTDQPYLEAHAFDLLTAALASVDSDRTLGGLVYTVEVSEGATHSLVNNSGTAVIVPFTVRYWAAL